MLQDGLGSVHAEVNSSGAVVASQTYTPYGDPINATGSFASPFEFTGEQTDSTGQIYLRARYYAPGMGVFTARDPYEGTPARPMSLNGYSYVEGNVVNAVDPSGAFAWDSYDSNDNSYLIEKGDYLACIARELIGTTIPNSQYADRIQPFIDAVSEIPANFGVIYADDRLFAGQRLILPDNVESAGLYDINGQLRQQATWQLFPVCPANVAKATEPPLPRDLRNVEAPRPGINLPKLPLRCWSREFGEVIGKSVGNFINSINEPIDDNGRRQEAVRDVVYGEIQRIYGVSPEPEAMGGKLIAVGELCGGVLLPNERQDEICRENPSRLFGDTIPFLGPDPTLSSAFAELFEQPTPVPGCNSANLQTTALFFAMGQYGVNRLNDVYNGSSEFTQVFQLEIRKIIETNYERLDHANIALHLAQSPCGGS